VCGPRYRGYGGGGFSSYAYSRPSYEPPSYSSPSRSSSGGGGGGGRSVRNARPRWSRADSAQLYTPEEVRALEPIRVTVEKRAPLPELRQIFLCHAWPDRQGVATDLYNLLIAHNVSVWFSERDISLGEPFMRAIDKGLAKSQMGIVLVTPAMLKTLPAAGVADKELSVLLARDQLVPIVHDTTYDALRDVSPMLASRNGLDTADMPMADVAAKLAELVAL
jgi:TIR domain